ncbi:MAG: YfhO family protein, partial [Actinomycetota bacterium]|nr:YfhO family protein [Actinomycetota bacterium]
MTRRAARRGLLLGLLFAVATAVMLRPTPSRISDGMPQNLGDSVLITWVMHWGAHALTTDPLSYFNGNVFWPAGNTLAYSDLLLPFVPVYGLFFAVTGNWPLATNLTVLTMFGLALTSTYLLGRRVLGSTAGSVLAALAFTFTGFHLSEWGHIQLHTIGLLPLAAYFAIRFLDERSWWLAAATGATTAATMLAAVYYGLLWFIALAVLFVGYAAAKRFRPGPRFVGGALVIGLVAVTMLGPALYKYAQQGEERGYEEYRGLKARDLITPAFGSYLWESRFTFEGAPALQEHGLYPGVTVAVLAVGGAVATASRRRHRPLGDRTAPVRHPGEDASPDARLHL